MKQVRLACIASGSGTDAGAIMKAWKAGWLPEISEVVLISTKEKDEQGKRIGCLEKADALGIRFEVVTTAIVDGKKIFLWDKALENLGGADLIFLVGCIVKVPDLGIPMYNIHPANPLKHGGQGMYGLQVHLHVLYEIADLVVRGMAKVTDRFFTEPTVHEAASEYDQGHELLRAQVEIPQELIQALMNGTSVGSDEDVAKRLQKIVLPFEHQMLPLAVRLAAKKILDQQKEGG